MRSLAILLFAAAPAFLSGCGRDEALPRRNVLVISIDSLRRDHVGAYGHRPRYGAVEQAYTPAIDGLAARGVLFEDAWTGSSWTLPSHMTLFTGMPDRLHGVDTDAVRLDPLRTTLAESFRASGWRTGGVYSGPYLDPRYGFDRGFDAWQSAMSTPEAFAAEVRAVNAQRLADGRPPLDSKTVRALRDRQSHIEVTSPRVNALARDFLDASEDRSQPFFLFLHYFDAHYDHLPETQDPALAEAFDPGYEGAFDPVDWFFNPQVMDKRPPFTRRVGERDLGHVMAMYEAEIHWVDRHVQAVLDMLQRRGLLEDTVVLLVSDHGDEFFDHAGIGHRSTLFPELCRIPAVLRVPGGPEGLRVPELVRMEDFAPTLLDLAGARAQLDEARGSSLRALVEGGGIGDDREAVFHLYSGTHSRGIGLNVRDGWRDRRWTVLRQFGPEPDAPDDGRLHLRPAVWDATGDPFLVFDRLADPRELRPLPATAPGYRDAVDAFCAAVQRLDAAVAALPRSSPELLRLDAPSEEEARAMAALGYAGAEEDAGTAAWPPLAPLPSPCD